MIDLTALQQDPDFKAKSPQEQQRLLSKATQQNALEGPPATYGEAAKRAGKNLLAAPGQALLGAANTAYQLWREPKATAQSLLKVAPEMALSMVPMQRTIRKRLAGQPVTGPEAAQEAIENVGSMALGKLIGAGAKKIAKSSVLGLPGAGVEAHAFTIPKAEVLPDTLRPTAATVQAADAALEAVTGMPLRWSMGKFRDAAEKLIQEQRNLSNPDEGFITELQNYIRTSDEGWSPAQLRAEARDLGAKVGGLKAERGRAPEHTTKGRTNTQEANYRHLLSALYEDADAAQPHVAGTYGEAPIPGRGQRVGTAAGPEAGDIRMQQAGGPGAGPRSADLVEVGRLWKQSRALHRRDMAANSLARMIDDNISAIGQEGFESINLRPVIKKIRRAQRKQEYDAQSRLFVNSFEPGEVDEIVKTLRDLQKNLRPIPPGRGVRTGSSQRFIHGAVGELVGRYFGAPPVLGAASGVAVAEGLTQAMMTAPGRALVRRAMKIDPSAGRVFQETIAAFLRGEMQPKAAPLPRPGTQPTPAPTPAPTPSLGDELLDSILKGGLMPNAHPEAYINAR